VSQAASAGYVNEFRMDNQNWEKFSLLLAITNSSSTDS